jgi:hypothetical protein
MLNGVDKIEIKRFMCGKYALDFHFRGNDDGSYMEFQFFNVFIIHECLVPNILSRSSLSN